MHLRSVVAFWAAPKPFGPTEEFELGNSKFCFACASPPRRSGAYGAERTYAPTPPHPYSAPHYGRHDISLARELRFQSRILPTGYKVLSISEPVIQCN